MLFIILYVHKPLSVNKRKSTATVPEVLLQSVLQCKTLSMEETTTLPHTSIPNGGLKVFSMLVINDELWGGCGDGVINIWSLKVILCLQTGFMEIDLFILCLKIIWITTIYPTEN